VTLHLVLLLAPFTSTIEDQVQVRELEERLSHFPPAEVIAESLRIGKEHIWWLKNAGDAKPSHWREAYAAHLAEAERLYDTWNSLHRARYAFIVDRCAARQGVLNHLPDGGTDLEETAKLIEALETNIGEEAFRAGRMPPPVPYWRFQWID
jgi:hypothetical protein